MHVMLQMVNTAHTILFRNVVDIFMSNKGTYTCKAALDITKLTCRSRNIGTSTMMAVPVCLAATVSVMLASVFHGARLAAADTPPSVIMAVVDGMCTLICLCGCFSCGIY